MTTVTTEAVRGEQKAPERLTPAGPRKTTRSAGARRPIAGVLPLFVFLALFLGVPLVVTAYRAFFTPDATFTLDYVAQLATPDVVAAFRNSIVLSVVTALGGAVGGLVLAWAMSGMREGPISKALLSFTGVASQMGGAPLAFAFIAMIGAQGLVTGWVADVSGFELNKAIPIQSFGALVLAYLYFQIPMMTILMLPAVQGLRREWIEGAESLGASSFRRLADIVLPVLAPSLAGSLILLFANSFSGYAAAYAMAGSGANLVPVLIGYYMSGNVMTSQGLASALVLGMIAVMAAAMLARTLLLRRTTRWLR